MPQISLGHWDAKHWWGEHPKVSFKDARQYSLLELGSSDVSGSALRRRKGRRGFRLLCLLGEGLLRSQSSLLGAHLTAYYSCLLVLLDVTN